MKTVAIAFVLSLCIPVGAQTIFRYDLTGLPSSGTLPASAAATTVAPGLTDGTLVRGPGIVAAGLGNGFSANNWNNPTTASGQTSASLANALLSGDYFQFSLSINPGYVASFSSLDVSLRRSAFAAPMNYQWQYSFDGFASPGTEIASFQYFGRSSGTAPATVTPYQWMTTDTAGQNNGNPMSTLDLSGFSNLQNVAAGSSITFRLYGWGDDAVTGAADSNTVALGRVDGPTLGGILTVVPEPSALAFVCLAGASLLLRRKN